MNFAEGIKRIYVTIVCLVLVASAIALFDDRPKEDRYDWTTANALMDDLAIKEKGQVMDMSKFSESDLRQIAKGDMRMVSEQGLRMLAAGDAPNEAKPDKNNVLWDDQPRSEFIAAQCSHPYWSGGVPGKWTITEYAEKRKDICDRYNHAKTELPKDLASHAAQSVGILALVAIGSIFFWMLMAWIGRGFIAKKTSAGSE